MVRITRYDVYPSFRHAGNYFALSEDDNALLVYGTLYFRVTCSLQPDGSCIVSCRLVGPPKEEFAYRCGRYVTFLLPNGRCLFLDLHTSLRLFTGHNPSRV